jgi:hypothetical protein
VPGLSLNARAVYTAKQYADAANTQQLPSWTRFDLGANYLTRIMDRDVTLRARVDNAFDRNYWASAGGYPGAGYLVLGSAAQLHGLGYRRLLSEAQKEKKPPTAMPFMRLDPPSKGCDRVWPSSPTSVRALLSA